MPVQNRARSATANIGGKGLSERVVEPLIFKFPVRALHSPFR
jgi:hypothetical protein